ncbi:hypothetical protein [Helicobacter salomonis]|nr:hypothetical protein [Helicobacter salomonis]
MYWLDLEEVDVENLEDLIERLEAVFEQALDNWREINSLCEQIACSKRFHCKNKEDAQKLGKLLADIDWSHSCAAEHLECLKETAKQIQQKGETHESV